jgi:hypothetical protein
MIDADENQAKVHPAAARAVKSSGMPMAPLRLWS